MKRKSPTEHKVFFPSPPLSISSKSRDKSSSTNNSVSSSFSDSSQTRLQISQLEVSHNGAPVSHILVNPCPPSMNVSANSSFTEESKISLQMSDKGRVIRSACDFCTVKKVKCDGKEQCENCRKRNLKCNYSERRRTGPKIKVYDGPGLGILGQRDGDVVYTPDDAKIFNQTYPESFSLDSSINSNSDNILNEQLLGRILKSMTGLGISNVNEISLKQQKALLDEVNQSSSRKNSYSSTYQNERPGAIMEIQKSSSTNIDEEKCKSKIDLELSTSASSRPYITIQEREYLSIFLTHINTIIPLINEDDFLKFVGLNANTMHKVANDSMLYRLSERTSTSSGTGNQSDESRKSNQLLDNHFLSMELPICSPEDSDYYQNAFLAVLWGGVAIGASLKGMQIEVTNNYSKLSWYYLKDCFDYPSEYTVSGYVILAFYYSCILDQDKLRLYLKYAKELNNTILEAWEWARKRRETLYLSLNRDQKDKREEDIENALYKDIHANASTSSIRVITSKKDFDPSRYQEFRIIIRYFSIGIACSKDFGICSTEYQRIKDAETPTFSKTVESKLVSIPEVEISRNSKNEKCSVALHALHLLTKVRAELLYLKKANMEKILKQETLLRLDIEYLLELIEQLNLLRKENSFLRKSAFFTLYLDGLFAFFSLLQKGKGSIPSSLTRCNRILPMLQSLPGLVKMNPFTHIAHLMGIMYLSQIQENSLGNSSGNPQHISNWSGEFERDSDIMQQLISRESEMSLGLGHMQRESEVSHEDMFLPKYVLEYDIIQGILSSIFGEGQGALPFRSTNTSIFNYNSEVKVEMNENASDPIVGMVDQQFEFSANSDNTGERLVEIEEDDNDYDTLDMSGKKKKRNSISMENSLNAKEDRRKWRELKKKESREVSGTFCSHPICREACNIALKGKRNITVQNSIDVIGLPSIFFTKNNESRSPISALINSRESDLQGGDALNSGQLSLTMLGDTREDDNRDSYFMNDSNDMMHDSLDLFYRNSNPSFNFHSTPGANGTGITTDTNFQDDFHQALKDMEFEDLSNMF